MSRKKDLNVVDEAISGHIGVMEMRNRESKRFRPALQEEVMKKITTLIAVLVVAGAALAANAPGIEVLGIEVLGIEVLNGAQMVETHSTDAPEGSVVCAVMDQGAGPMIVNSGPVCPMSGLCTVVFPFEHPNNRVELRDPSGMLLSTDIVDGGLED